MYQEHCKVPDSSKLEELFASLHVLSTPNHEKDGAKSSKIDLVLCNAPEQQDQTYDFKTTVLNTNPSFLCKEMALLCNGVTNEDVDKLVDTLHSNYFALHLATTFINAGVGTISKYLDMYSQTKKTLLDDDSIELIGQNESTFITTILKFYEHCPKEKMDAINGLEIIAYISQFDIPVKYFEFDSVESKNAKMLNELYYYVTLHFIAVSPDKTLIKVYPVAQAALRWIMKQMSVKAQVKKLTVVTRYWMVYLINSRNPNSCERKSNQIELVKSIRRNMAGLKEMRNSAIALGITECIQLLGSYQFQQLTDFAEDIFNTDSEWSQRDDVGGDYISHILQTRRFYAAGLAGLRRYEEALNVLNDIFDKTEHIDEYGHRSEIFLVLNDIGAVLAGMGRESETLRIYDDVLSKVKIGDSGEHIYMDVMHNKARVLWKLGMVDEAMAITSYLYQERLKSLKFGSDNVATVAEKFYFGYGLMKTGELKMALKVLEEVYASQVHLFGLNHPKRLNTANLVEHVKTMIQQKPCRQWFWKSFQKNKSKDEKTMVSKDTVEFLMEPLHMFQAKIKTINLLYNGEYY